MLAVRARVGLLLVMAPENQGARIPPGGVVGPDELDDGITLRHPSGEDLLCLVVEPHGPVLPVPAALPADIDVRLGARVVDVVEPDPADLGVLEAHTELQVDDDVLQRGLGKVHEGLILVVLQPVGVDPHVGREDDLHTLRRVVLVEQEVALEVAELLLLVGYLVVLPRLVEKEGDSLRIYPVRGCVVPRGLRGPPGPLEAPFALLTRIRLGADELGVQELPDAAVWSADVLGHPITRFPPRRGRETPVQRRRTGVPRNVRSRPP